MNRYIILKHFIDGRENLNLYKKKIRELKIAEELSAVHAHNFRFGLKVTVDENLSDELSEELRDSFKELPRDSFLIYNPRKTGGGNGFKQIVFNQTFSDESSLVYMVALDQFPINSEESLNRLDELGNKVEKDKALYAIGSRNVQVVLGIHPVNSRRRIIHELFHTLAAPEGVYRVSECLDDITPAYRDLGECTTGVSIMNHTHLRYPDLLQYMARATQSANMSGNAADYYVAIKAPLLAKIATGYVNAIENPFHYKKSQEEEWQNFKNMIFTQTKELGKTDVRENLYQALIKHSNTKRLSEFYPMQEVEYIRDLMLETMI